MYYWGKKEYHTIRFPLLSLSFSFAVGRRREREGEKVSKEKVVESNGVCVGGGCIVV